MRIAIVDDLSGERALLREQLARQLQVTSAAVSKWERGGSLR